LNLDENIRALERTPLFADAGSDALRLLAFSAEVVNLGAGDILFERGEEAQIGYTVMRGRIKLGAGDNGSLVAGPGTLIGEMALLVETTRPCSAYALEPAQLLAIPRPLFRRMLEAFPDIAAGLRTKLISRMRAEHATLQRIQSQLGAGPSRD
jgi:CRP-like cAMP-binding protein